MSSRTAKRQKKRDEIISWLPIDSRFIPDIFSFSNVRGISKVFLQIELIVSVIVVILTVLLIVLKLFGL